VNTALLLSSLYLSAVDIRTHKIRNKSLLAILFVFTTVALIEKSSLYPISALIFLSIGLAAAYFGLGAGDVKLVTVLSLFFLPLEITRWIDWIHAFIWIVAFIVLIQLVNRKSLADPIPLAPAICAAFIWCAR
jgi:Flp pilus assembly protein protease CpaA